MTRLSGVVLLAALAIVLVGCGGSAKQSANDKVASPRDVVQLTKNVPCFSGHQTVAGPDAVSRFHAVTAVMCTGGTRIYPRSGKWSVRVRNVAVSSVADLQRYFERHSLTSPITSCTLQLEVVPSAVLVDSRGHWIVAQGPVDPCHHPLGFPPRVRWRVVHVEKLRRLLSAPVVAAGCPAMRWGRPIERSWGQPAVFRVHRKAASVCVYRTSARHQWVGSFVRGRRLDMAQTKRLVAALKAGPSRAGCPRQTTWAEVITTPGIDASVELGGCYRVNGGPGTANAAVIRSMIGFG